MKRIAFLLMVGLLGFSSAASAQETGTSYFFGGSGSFTSTKAADADADAERSTVLAANPSLLFELSTNLYVGGAAFITDDGESSEFTFDPSVLYLLGDAGTIPYVQAAVTDITGDRSYGGQIGILAPFEGVYIDANVFYRRLQGVEADGDQIGVALGFRLKR